MGSPGRVQPSNRSPCCAPPASRAPTLIPKPGPARHLPTPAQTYRPLTLPHSSAQPDPWGHPSPGTLLLPSADRFRSDLFPPGSPLPCLPGAPPFPGVFLSPFPLQATGIRQLAPSRFCRAPDPKAQPWPSPRKAWPSPASDSDLPSLDLGGWLPRSPPSLIPSPPPLQDPPSSCGHPLTGSWFSPFLGPGPFASCSRSVHSQAWSPSPKQPCPLIPSTWGPPAILPISLVSSSPRKPWPPTSKPPSSPVLEF